MPSLASVQVVTPTVTKSVSLTTEVLLTIHEERSPVSDVRAQVVGPDGQYLDMAPTLVGSNGADSTWRVRLTLPAAAAAGTWRIGTLTATDAAGNTMKIAPTAIPVGDRRSGYAGDDVLKEAHFEVV
jgi:hypothetical protein